MYYGGFTFTEAFNLPIGWRRWFIQRINKEFERANSQQSKGAHQNTPDIRQLQGNQRTTAPARMQRFT